MFSAVWRNAFCFPTRRDTATLVFGAVLIVALAIASCAGIGFVRFERMAADERLAAERTERANADLQDALFRMRDEVAETRRRIDGLADQLAAAEARAKAADELERQLAAYEEAMARRAAAAQRRSPRSRRGRGSVAAALANAPAPEQPPAMAAASIAAGSGELKNFTAPAWVPSYFASESAPFLGSSKQ
jgi:hypothetical protein